MGNTFYNYDILVHLFFQMVRLSVQSIDSLPDDLLA